LSRNLKSRLIAEGTARVLTHYGHETNLQRRQKRLEIKESIQGTLHEIGKTERGLDHSDFRGEKSEPPAAMSSGRHIRREDTFRRQDCFRRSNVALLLRNEL